MSDNEELITIRSKAFLQLLLHVFRFWNEKVPSENKTVYGLLLGSIEGDHRVIKKIVSMFHTDNKNYEMDAKFIKQVGEVNGKEIENNSTDEVIGWYRSSNEGIKFTARDIKNQIKFQEFNPRFVSLIIDPKIYLTPNEFGFSVFRLKGEKYYNIMSDFCKIPWEITPIEDPQEIIGEFQKYIRNFFLNKPLVNEINEQT